MAHADFLRPRRLQTEATATRTTLITLVAIVAIGQLSGYGGSRIAAEELSPEWVRREAPKAWARYRQRFDRWKRSLHGTVRSKGERTKPRRQLLWEWKIELMRQGPLVRVVAARQTYGAPDGSRRERPGEVFCINDRYAFQLRRARQGISRNRWFLTRLDPAPGEFVGFHIGKLLECLRWASLVELPMAGLPELFAQKGFHLQEATRDDDRVETCFALEGSPEEFWGLKSGMLVFDPRNDWCLKYAETVVRLEGDWVKTTVAFQPVRADASGLLVSRKTIQQYDSEHYAGYEVYHLDLRNNAEPIEESAFELSAFGLENPDVSRPEATGVWLVFSVNGIVLIIVGVYLLYRSRRVSGKR